MSRWSHAGNSPGDALALEAQAARAGLALACTNSNSAEFDAELIAARRAAGVYGPRRFRRRAMSVAGIAAGLTLIAVAVMLIT